jgi:hypothetical protein
MALALVMLGPGAAEAQKGGSGAMSIGTTAKYEGVTPLPSDCQNEASYEQFMKVAGQVILPETRANVYKFIEYWGRDSGTQIQRTAANGDVFLYLSRGVEQRAFVNGPVGTYWDVTDPESGTTLRFVIAEAGITLTLPTGQVWYDVKKMRAYLGPSWTWYATYWLSPDAGLPIQIWTWEGVEECSGQTWPPRRHWLVSITRK